MMQQMRENTKWIMLVTALAFVGLMVFEWGMDMTGRSGAQFTGGEIGRVNGQPITYEEYYTVYQNLYAQQQQALGSVDISNAMNRQIEDAAFDQVVLQKLIAQELRRRDLTASDTEVRQAARYMPPPEIMADSTFWTDGQFDLDRYHAFLASPALDPQSLLRLEDYYRQTIPRSKLYYRTTAGTFVTDNELWRMWRDTRDAVTVSYLAFDPSVVVPDESISVSDAEIADYYNRNRESFSRPGRARVRYLILDKTPTPADSAASLARAEAVVQRIRDGAEFADVAMEESEDPTSAENGGLLEITRGQTLPQFDSVAFSAPVGSVVGPVRSPAGYHIIRVESRSGDEAEVRHILIPIERTLDSENALFDRADSLEALTETMKLDAAAQQLGLQAQQTELVPGLTILPGLPEAEDAEYWAFNDGEIGEVSELFETPRAFYALELLDRQEARTLTLEEASNTVREAVRAEKRLARTEERARDALERLRAGASIEEVAAQLQATAETAGPFTRGDFVPGLGRFTPAIGAAFGLEPDEISDPVSSDGKVYLIRVDGRTNASRAEWEEQKEQQRLRVTQAVADQRWQQYLQALRDAADVVDVRDQVLNQTAPATATF